MVASVDPAPNVRSLRNFPMQANGAEMMRVAACLATERGGWVCCLVHDAFLVEAPVDEIGEAVATTQKAIREASEIVLGGFGLKSAASVVRWPARHVDHPGKPDVDLVSELSGGQ